MNELKIADIIEKPNGSPAYMNQHIRRKLAPFVLFDAGLVSMKNLLVDWHPHSGVATITLPFAGVVYHNDSERFLANKKDDQAIYSGGAQWMASGNGIWHRERGESIDNELGMIQSWLLLPPGQAHNQENGQPSYNDLQDADISQTSDENNTRTKVLIGEYEQNGEIIKGNLTDRDDVNYFYVHIKKGQSWEFESKEAFNRGLSYVTRGKVAINNIEVDTHQLAVWYESSGTVKVTALEDSEFAFAVAKPWPHKMVVHYGQVHTSKENLESGSAQIQKLGSVLQSSLNQE